MIFRDVNPPVPSENKQTEPAAMLSKKNAAHTRFEMPEVKRALKKPTSFELLLPERCIRKNRLRAVNLSLILGLAVAILIAINIIHLATSGLRFKTDITEAASSGFEKIVNGAMAISESNFENAAALFANAEKIFKNMRSRTWFISPKIGMLTLRDPMFESAHALIEAGKHLSAAGINFTEVASELEFLPRSFFEANEKRIVAADALSPEFYPSLTEKLKKQMPGISAAASSLALANSEMQKVPDAFVPRDLRDKFRFAKDALAALSKIVESLKNDMPAILSMLGDDHPHTYLILLQNNAEIRPSGGFIGNYMILEVNDGYVTKSEVFDIYSADHQLKEILAPPAEILPANPRWFMRDSNYSGHFPLSAEKAAWFLEKEGGPGVDTVIAIDTSFIVELLRLTGPTKIPELRLALDAENFSAAVSYIIESKIFGRENPKTILKSFMANFQKALFERIDPAKLVPVLDALAESKHLLAYSKNPDVQEFFEMRGIAGLMKNLEPKEDYLNIIHTSIGGNKSDAYITEEITHDTYLKSDGRVIDEVAITRTHGWNDETERHIRETATAFGFPNIAKNVMEILGRSRNIHALRIYVPKGVTLEGSSDSEIALHEDPETGKSYFSATMLTPVGTSETLTVRYALPFTLNLDPVDKYSLTVQKQAGQERVNLQKRIFPESGIKNYKYFPENLGEFDADGIWHYENALERDMQFVSIWGK